MITFDAARGGSTGFKQLKLYFKDKLGIMEKYSMMHLLKKTMFYTLFN